jgi:hypothetical protein
MLPPPFLGAIARRVALLWTFLHTVGMARAAIEGATGPPSFEGSWATPFAVCAIILVVMRVELWRRAEMVFLANLGCSWTRVAVLVVAECAVLETALRLAVA